MATAAERVPRLQGTALNWRDTVTLYCRRAHVLLRRASSSEVYIHSAMRSKLARHHAVLQLPGCHLACGGVARLHCVSKTAGGLRQKRRTMDVIIYGSQVSLVAGVLAEQFLLCRIISAHGDRRLGQGCIQNGAALSQLLCTMSTRLPTAWPRLGS